MADANEAKVKKKYPSTSQNSLRRKKKKHVSCEIITGRLYPLLALQVTFARTICY